MSKKINIGVMGCANIAHRSVIPAILDSSNFNLIAVASRSKEKADLFAELFNCKGIVGYQNLLEEKIDAVYMPLPTGLHEEWVLKCISRGKHVFVEKSFSITSKSAKIMIDAALSKNIVIMENFMFQYHKQHEILLKLLHENTIGEIRNFKSSFGFPPLPRNNFRYDEVSGGGALLDAGAYTIKSAQLFFGKELDLIGSHLVNDSDLEVDIAGSAYLIHKEKTSIQLSWGFDNFYQCGYDIWGSKGRITTNRSFTAPPGYQPTLKLEKQGETTEYLLPADNHFVNILNQFSENINLGRYEDCAEEVYNQSLLLGNIKEINNSNARQSK